MAHILEPAERAALLDHLGADFEARLAEHRRVAAVGTHANQILPAIKYAAEIVGMLAELEIARQALVEGENDE